MKLVKMMESKNISKISEKKNEGSKWFEIVATLTVSLITMTGSMLFCWPSPYLVKIVKDENYDITEEQASYFTVLGQIGVIILPPFLAPIANRIGRKKVMLMTSPPYITSWLIKAFATDLWLLYCSRLCAGFGDAIILSCGMAYVGEVTSPEIRGLWGNSLLCFGLLGQFIVNILGIYFSIQTTSFICVTIPIIFVIMFSFLPETPYFYIAKGREEEAKRSLRKLRRKEYIDEEFKQIQIAVQNQSAESGSWKELLSVEINRKAVFVGLFLRLAQIFAGSITFSSYTLLIFQKSGTNLSPEVSTLIYTGMNLVFYTAAIFGSNKLGRRKSVIISLILTGIGHLAESIYFLTEKLFPEVNLESLQWFPLAGMVTFLICSSFGVGTVPALMMGEIFSISNKSKGMALVTSFFGILIFTVNNLFYYLNSYTGLFGPFLMFSLCNFISAIVMYFFLPETKNKTLEEIQEQLRKRKSIVN